MRDWLNSLDYKYRTVYKERLTQGAVYFLKFNALVLLLAIAHCSKLQKDQGRRSQSIELYRADKDTLHTHKSWLTMTYEVPMVTSMTQEKSRSALRRN